MLPAGHHPDMRKGTEEDQSCQNNSAHRQPYKKDGRYGGQREKTTEEHQEHMRASHSRTSQVKTRSATSVARRVIVMLFAPSRRAPPSDVRPGKVRIAV